MAHPYEHAKSSVLRFGGEVDDYLPLHNWFDETKAYMALHTHRALRHHAAGIFWAEEKFGIVIINSNHIPVPTRLVAEQHIREDCGFIPSVQDWFKNIPKEPWMYRKVSVDPEKRPTPEYEHTAKIEFSILGTNEHGVSKQEFLAGLTRKIMDLQERPNDEFIRLSCIELKPS